MKKLALALTFFAAAQCSAQSFLTSDNLRLQCLKAESTDPRPPSAVDHGERMACLSFLSGVQMTILVLGNGGPGNSGVCFPSVGLVTMSQMSKIFLKYINENPARLHEPAGIAVVQSLRAAFPCR